MVACGPSTPSIFFAGSSDGDGGHHEKQRNVKKTTKKKHPFEKDEKTAKNVVLKPKYKKVPKLVNF
jgi:hypothetical protein